MKSAAGLFINLLLPPRCPVSGEIVDRQGALSPDVWRALTFIEEPCCQQCGLPFAFRVETGALCAPCLAKPPVFQQARSAMVYDDASRELILAFKHGDRLESVPVLIPLLRRAGTSLLDRAEIIVPVPLHRWRLLRRRYNQAGLLAQALGRAAGKDVMVDALVRTRATPSQGHLNAGQREKNVRHAFAPGRSAAARLSGKSVLLVDDVYTTGATLSECARVLLAAGAKDVLVLTLARVVRAEKVF